MPDYILLMHDDVPRGGGPRGEDWSAYIAQLDASNQFRGGSAIGAGICARKTGTTPAITGSLTGFIRIAAIDLAHARSLLAGNPVYEAGGTVEIRELPTD